MISGKQIKDISISKDKLDFAIAGTPIIQYNGDYRLVPPVTSGDESATSLFPSADPYVNTGFYVFVNGAIVDLGDFDKTKDCYFSEDGGSSALAIADLGTQSQLFWNGLIAEYDLSTTDIISFQYEIKSEEILSAGLTGPTGPAGPGASPAGNQGNIQFNSAGSFGASDEFGWNNTSKTLGIGTYSSASKLHVKSVTATDITSIFQGTTAQTANLTEWRDSAEVVKGVVNKDGWLGVGATPSNTITTSDAGGSAGGVHIKSTSSYAAISFSTPLVAQAQIWLSAAAGNSLMQFYNPNANGFNFTGKTYFSGDLNLVPTALAHIGASTTARASLRINSGVAPTAPNGGDIFYEGADALKFYNGSATKTFAFSEDIVATTPAGSTGEIQFNSAGAFGADSGLFWDNTNKRLGLGATPLARLHLKTTSGTGIGQIIELSASQSVDSFQVRWSNANKQLWVDKDGSLFGGADTDGNAHFQINTFGRLFLSRSGAGANGSGIDGYNDGEGGFGLSLNSNSAAIGFRVGSVNAGTNTAKITAVGFRHGAGLPTASLHAGASTTARASLRLDSGVAPTTPNAGDIFYEGVDALKFYNGAATKTFAFSEDIVATTPAGSTGEIQFNNAGAFGASSDLFWDDAAKRFSILKTTGAANTSIPGIFLENSTAASVGNQQHSPELILSGRGWGTTAGTSQVINFKTEVIPVQGATVTGRLAISSSVDGGAYVERLSVNSAGGITTYGHILSSTTSNRIGTWGGQDFLYGAFNSGGVIVGQHPNTGFNGVTTQGGQIFSIGQTWVGANSYVRFYSNNAETMRITSTNNLLVGTTTDAGQRLQVNGSSFLKATAATDIVSIFQGATSQSANLTEWRNSVGSIKSSVSSDGNITAPIILANDKFTITNGSATSSTSVSIISATATTTNIYTTPVSSGDGLFVDYVLYDTGKTNMRGGTIKAIWNQSGSIVDDDIATGDIGNTVSVTFDAIISGSDVVLQMSTPDTSWVVKMVIRIIN